MTGFRFFNNMLKLGIVGLPNVGKSTLFNALTGSRQADAQNYPFCTIEPNMGVVEVPDKRLRRIGAVSDSQKIIPTAIEFVDIAGLVEGASRGEGLGNKFLSHIREVDAIIQVLRGFFDQNVAHVSGKIDPNGDADIINTELVLADLQTVARRIDKVKKQAKGAAAKILQPELALLQRLYTHLQSGLPAREFERDPGEEEIIKELFLLTAKPVLYVVNTDEKEVAVQEDKNKHRAGARICARLEAELAELPERDRKQYMKELGMQTTGLDKVIVKGYSLLDLETFFTSGAPETRAWTVKKGTRAPLAAGVIHTDFIKQFIKADVVDWSDFVRLGGWINAREKGKMRLEGRDYLVKDGDVCYFHTGG